MSRPTLRQLLEGGEVDRLFKRSGNWSAVAAELGVNERTLRRAREEWRSATTNLVDVSSSLVDGAYRDADKFIGASISDDFADEEPTQPGIHISIEDDIADRRERAETATLKAKLKHALDQLEQCRYELSVALDAQSALRDPPPIEPRERMGGKREATAFAMASDWHIEETVDVDSVNGVNEFNLDIAYRRVRRFFDGFCFLTKYHSDYFLIRDAKLWLGGDLITGYLRDEDLETNSLSPVQAVAELHGWLCQGIRQYLDEVPVERLDLDCSSGNHGRLTEKMHHRGREANSIEWLLYHMIAREFANEPRVNVTLPKGAHNYAQVYDLVIRETHGDGTKGGSGVGGIMIPIRKAIAKWETVRRAHLTIMGHWHQEHFLNDLHINGSLVGYGPYSLSIPAPYEPPRQSFFLVDKYRGVSMPSTIWLEDSRREREAA
jgi:hypothetical protein